MHLAILIYKSERNEYLPGTIALKACAEAMGHTVTMLNELTIQVCFGSKSKLTVSGEPFPKFDAIITRPLIKKDPSVYVTLLRQLELEGQLVINDAQAIEQARNKIRTLQLLDQAGLPIPKTIVLSSADQLEQAMKHLTFPVVVKAPYGIGGKGTFLAESLRSLRPLAEHLLKETTSKDSIQIQEYIKEAKGRDLRVFVVGGRVVAAMQRTAKRGDFRANIHRGGVGKAITPTKKEVEISLAATKCVGLDVSGVDILRTKTGPVIIEVNSTPGFEGIMVATGIDVIKEIILHTEQRIRARKIK